MNTKIHFQNATFLTSAAKVSQCPPADAVEIAFAGRSNAGKSSALNTLTRQTGLARTSKTPGRTQLLNFFQVTEALRLVDLPGYGYAKVPIAVKEKWAKLIDGYMTSRECLQGVVLIMDIRHPLKPFDEQMVEWSAARSLPLHLVLTKADKLGRGAQQATLLDVQKSVSTYPNVTCQLFSSSKKTGVQELETWITLFLQN
jgi:GTP-binding protein